MKNAKLINKFIIKYYIKLYKKSAKYIQILKKKDYQYYQKPRY